MSEKSSPDAYKDFLKGIGDFSSEANKDAKPLKVEGDASQEDVSIGQQVRAFRREKGFTRQDVGQRTGLDVVYLEEIESGGVAPPLGVLIKIAKALNMRLGRFISSGEIKPFTIVRKDQRKAISRFTASKDNRYGYTYESLAADKKDRHMEPFMVTLVPSGAKKELSSHEGQEFIYVLKGVMEVTLDDEIEVLHPGDSIYYDSTVPHLVRCHGENEAVILAVLYTD